MEFIYLRKLEQIKTVLKMQIVVFRSTTDYTQMGGGNLRRPFALFKSV